mgnify:CR=1 FL=1
MVDVLDQIKPFLIFNSEDNFYFLQLLQRKKENPHLGSNSRVIKNYYIKSEGHLVERYPEIKTLCEIFNARAMLRLRPRSFRKVGVEALKLVAEHIYNDNNPFIRKAYDRCSGRYSANYNKSWVIDIDGEIPEGYIEEMKAFIEDCKPRGQKFLIELPTKNGIHLITRPFQLDKFRECYPSVDVHKDNPINLYIPDFNAKSKNEPHGIL